MWQIYDIIDLEYLLHLEQSDNTLEGQEKWHERDRSFYLEAVEKYQGPPPRSKLLHGWLQFRKEQLTDQENIQAGQVIKEILQLFQLFLMGGGLLLGWGIGFSYFHYTGTEPLNVFTFLTIFIFTQILLTLLLLISTLIRSRKKGSPPQSLIYKLLTKAFMRLLFMSKQKTFEKLTASQRLSLEATWGTIQGKKQYGMLFYWPLFTQMQLFGICFNLSLLGVSLFNVIATDLAFGWQSTLQLSNEAIHSFVQILASPWSWFVNPPYPSLAEIEGSRIILKDGIGELATPDLVSWWPFLLLSLIFYGLLPRIGFFLTGLYFKKNSLDSLTFDHGSHDTLLQRMYTPHVTTQAEPEEPREQQLATLPQKKPHPQEQKPVTPQATLQPKEKKAACSTQAENNQLTVLIAEDIFPSCSEQELAELLSQKGYSVSERISFGEDIEQDQQTIIRLDPAKISAGGGLLILMEAWLPPISDFTLFLEDLRKHLPAPIHFRVGLLGKPTAETIFTPVEPSDFKVWQKKLKGLGDSHLRVEHLITTARTPSENN